jgi:hypothetical protein
LGAGDAKGEGADALDEAGEPGVGGGELGDREGGVVTRRARARARMRHEDDGIRRLMVVRTRVDRGSVMRSI